VCLEFAVCESLSLAYEIKDSFTTDSLPATETGLPNATQSSYRKSSLPDGSQKTITSKPPVPVFRKRTSTGSCAITDADVSLHEQSTVGSVPDSVNSGM